MTVTLMFSFFEKEKDVVTAPVPAAYIRDQLDLDLFWRGIQRRRVQSRHFSEQGQLSRKSFFPKMQKGAKKPEKPDDDPFRQNGFPDIGGICLGNEKMAMLEEKLYRHRFGAFFSHLYITCIPR